MCDTVTSTRLSAGDPTAPGQTRIRTGDAPSAQSSTNQQADQRWRQDAAIRGVDGGGDVTQAGWPTLLLAVCRRLALELIYFLLREENAHVVRFLWCAVLSLIVVVFLRLTLCKRRTVATATAGTNNTLTSALGPDRPRQHHHGGGSRG